MQFFKSLRQKCDQVLKKTTAVIKWPFQKLKGAYQFSKESLKLSIPFFRLKPTRIKVLIPLSYTAIMFAELYLNYFSLKKANENSEDFKENFTLVFSHMVGSYCIMFLKSSVNRYASYQLTHAIKQDLINKTLNNQNVLLGITFLQQQEEFKKNPNFKPFTFHSTILECNQFSEGVVHISYNVMNTITSTIINGYYLLFAMRLINDYKILSGGLLLNMGCLGFAVLANSLLTSSNKKMQEIGEKILAQFNHLQANQLEIACLKAESLEKELMQMEYIERLKRDVHNNNILFVFMTVNNIVYALLPAFLDVYAPSLLKTQKLNFLTLNIFKSNIMQIIYGLKYLIIDSIEKIPAMRASQERILQYYQFLSAWQNFLQKRALKTNYQKPYFQLRNFSVHIPNEWLDLGNIAKLKQNANFLSAITFPNINFRIKKGIIIKLTGASGAGKSTFLKALIGQSPCTFGNIDFPCQENEIFFMSQNTLLINNLTLLEVIFYPNIQSISEPEKAKLIDLMRTLKLTDKIKLLETKQDWNQTLSGGEKRKICLLRALVKSEKIKFLILDEPTAHMDVESKEIAYSLIKSLFQHAIVIYTEHEIDEDALLNQKEAILEKSTFTNKESKYQKDHIQKTHQGQVAQISQTSQIASEDNLSILRAYRNMSEKMKKQTFYTKVIEIDPKKRCLVMKT